MPSYKATIKIHGAVEQHRFARVLDTLRKTAIALFTRHEPGWASTTPDCIIIGQHLRRIAKNRSEWKEIERIRYEDVPVDQLEWRKRYIGHIARATFTRESICQCGFPVLRPDVPLGKEYELVTSKTDSFTWICGGCGHAMNVTGIFALNHPGHPGFLPMGIFEIHEKENEEATNNLVDDKTG